MPIVPAGGNPTANSPGLMAQRPSDTNLLMAAATMHDMGRLVDPELSAPTGGKKFPNPSKPHKGRKLKLVK